MTILAAVKCRGALHWGIIIKEQIAPRKHRLPHPVYSQNNAPFLACFHVGRWMYQTAAESRSYSCMGYFSDLI